VGLIGKSGYWGAGKNMRRGGNRRRGSKKGSGGGRPRELIADPRIREKAMFCKIPVGRFVFYRKLEAKAVHSRSTPVSPIVMGGISRMTGTANEGENKGGVAL